MTNPYCGTVCTACYETPAILSEQERLFLFPSAHHTSQKLQQFLAEHHHDSALLPQPRHSIEVRVAKAEAPELMTRLASLLSEVELRQTRALFKGSDRELSIADFSAITSLHELSARIGSGWLVDLLNQGGLTSHFQPIVPVGAPDRAFAYEALLRGVGADGRLIPPLAMFDVARNAGLLPQLDLAARRSALQLASRAGIDAVLFINLNPSAIVDPTYCVASILQAIDEAHFTAEQVVFEIVESDRARDPEQLLAVVRALQQWGFRIALDDFGAGYSSLNLLHRLKPDFIKLDRELVQGIDQDPYKAALVAHLLNFAHPLGIATIAEGVETRSEFEWFETMKASYVQGYWIAKPAPLRELSLQAAVSPSSPQ